MYVCMLISMFVRESVRMFVYNSAHVLSRKVMKHKTYMDKRRQNINSTKY